MTDENRNQQGGAPSADPIRQEPHEFAIEIPENIQGMTPHEIAEYARENPEEWEKAVKSMNASWDKLGNMLAESVGKTVTAATLAAMTGTVTEDLSKTISGISVQLFNTDFGVRNEIIARRVAEIEASLQGIIRSIAIANQLPDDIDTDALAALYKECEELKPYITAELEKRKEELSDMTADEFIDYLPTIAPRKTDKEEIPAEKKTRGQRLIDEVKADLLAILNAARAARDAQAAEAAPRATIKRAESVEYPLDKPNSKLWNLLEKDTAGQVEFNLAKNGSKLYLPAVYSINFAGLGNDISITKRLTPFDKLAYIAITALFNAGNSIVTLQQIYYAMGYTGIPGDTDRTKIYNTIHKMRKADIFFDNDKEATAYKYARFKYEGALLPCEIGEAFINGKWTDKAIHIFREPPLITFAKERKQITTIDIKLLQAPVSKTDANLQIQDYLLERICKAKNGRKKNCRILYKTLFANTSIATKKQQQRAPAKLKKYLEHYQREGFIKNFTMEKDSLTVYW